MNSTIAMTATSGNVRLLTRFRQSEPNASPGNARNVTELIVVPSIDRPTTQPLNERLPTKYSSVLVLRRAK